MVAKEPKNEQRVCKAVMCLVADRRGERIVKAEPVDAIVRDRPAVEWVFDTPTARFAVEHTRIESFPKQIGEGKRFAQLLGPLETELAGKLPGAFFLIVDVGTAKAPSGQHAELRKALSEWILAKGAALDPEEQTGPHGNCKITESPPGVPFEVTLHRDSNYDSRLFIIQNLTGDLESLRRDRIREALSRKCPKLLEAQRGGRVSVLILESDDIALANQVAIAEATVEELAARSDAPDVVIWARTSTQPWKAWLIKEGTDVHPHICAGGPFVLDPSCGAA
ncbi:MAG: hypothetical protein ACE5JX_20940 [Acidobacteriota bacterium]